LMIEWKRRVAEPNRDLAMVRNINFGLDHSSPLHRIVTSK
jgi:hypothetical protein